MKSFVSRLGWAHPTSIEKLWEEFVQDIAFAVRVMGRNRAFTILVTLTLALGIGTNTAIYSLMDAILVRALPVADPSSLVLLKWHSKPPQDAGADGKPTHVMHDMSGDTEDDPKFGLVAGIFPYPAFDLIQKNESVFSHVFAYREARDLDVVIQKQAEVDQGEYVSGNYFGGLGVTPAAGRVITLDDDRLDAPVVLVVSFGFSQVHFGEPAHAIGQEVSINHVPATIVGVAPPEFFGVNPAASPDFYLPFHSNVLVEAINPYGTRPETYLEKNEYWVEMMARLRPHLSIAQARAVLGPQFHQWVESTASTDMERANLPELLLEEGGGGLLTLRRQYSKALYILMFLVGVILAIVCANIANLLLARGARRRPEIALRLSLGAGRSRLVRQLLTESILLAVVGGAMGVLAAVWGIPVLSALLTNGHEQWVLRADVNWHVLAVAGALSLLTGILFGLVPALQSTRPEVLPALKETHSSDAPARSSLSLSNLLIVSQIALSLLLLVTAGFLVQTLSNLQSVEMGFNQENLLLFHLNARQAGRPAPEIASFYRDLQQRFSSIPGVSSVALANYPLIGHGHWATNVSVAGKPAPGTVFLEVGPTFFATMQIPIRQGRGITEQDQSGSLPVVVVSERFAKINFGSDSPIGRHIVFGGGNSSIHAHDLEIVGVARNARYGDMKQEIPPVLYVSYMQGYLPFDEVTYTLRTTNNPLAYVKIVREIVHQADPYVPVDSIRTQSGEIDRTIRREITFARLSTAFALLALMIACIGLYGTMSYRVARRTGEIGVRVALGARRSTIIWMVLREVLILTAVGLLVSVPVAFWTSRLLESLLFRTRPSDLSELLLASLTLLGSACLAGYLPARKASKIDPMAALRHE